MGAGANGCSGAFSDLRGMTRLPDIGHRGLRVGARNFLAGAGICDGAEREHAREFGAVNGSWAED
jgi:hypothetical protein